MNLGDERQAALNVHAAQPRAFDRAGIEAAEALAGSASASLRFAVRAAYLDDRQKDLETALTSRRVITTAVGIIMFQRNVNSPASWADVTRPALRRAG